MQEKAPPEEYVDFEEISTDQKNGFWLKIESLLDSRYFVVICVFLISFISFLLGRISVLEADKPPIRITQSGLSATQVSTERVANIKSNEEASVINSNLVPSSNQEVVASKNGTKYHYSWCAGANQISEKNKIVFASIEEARAKGYTPAANCKGLK